MLAGAWRAQQSCFDHYKAKSTTHLSPFSFYGHERRFQVTETSSEWCLVPTCVKMFESLLSLWIPSAMLWFNNVHEAAGMEYCVIPVNQISTSWGRPDSFSIWAKARVQNLFFTELLLLEFIVSSSSEWAHATKIGTTVCCVRNFMWESHSCEWRKLVQPSLRSHWDLVVHMLGSSLSVSVTAIYKRHHCISVQSNSTE